jgi:hypothetical protein
VAAPAALDVDEADDEHAARTNDPAKADAIAADRRTRLL